MPGDDVRGRLDALILSVVEETPLHGYAVITALESASGGRLQLATGTVYPALRRLERSGLVQGEWATVGGRRRRTYRITPSGRRVLGEERVAWADFSRIVGGILGTGTATRAAGRALRPAGGAGIATLIAPSGQGVS